AAPIVTSISPTAAPAATYGPPPPGTPGGGNQVIITGSHFSLASPGPAGAIHVRFGTTDITNFHVDSDSQITVYASPSLPAGTVRVTVWSGYGDSDPSLNPTNDLFTYTSAPIVTSISPT